MIRTDNITNINIFLKVFSDGIFLMLLCHGIYILFCRILARKNIAVILCAVSFIVFSLTGIYNAASFEIRAYYLSAYAVGYIIYRNSLYYLAEMIYGKIFSFLASVFSFFLGPVRKLSGNTARKAGAFSKKIIKKTSSLSQKAKKVYNTYTTYFREKK